VGILTDARTLIALARGAGHAGSHAERLNRFYAGQAEHYDRFRDRLLHGRRELVALLPAETDSHIVELGGGTGRNLDFFGERLAQFASATIVDLCEPLLAVARQRYRSDSNVYCVLDDVTRWRPDALVDCVFFSYALTMIPDWRKAVANAVGMLRPGGVLGVVDFHVCASDGPLARAFWPRWFAHDGVQLSAAHLPHLRARLETLEISERHAPVPYLPAARVPYYIFLGRKRA
jgi:S-adenosylmethionine-diacylgycerolhomoserine-N-methlytransferase